MCMIWLLLILIVKVIVNDGQVKNSNETFVGCFKVRLLLFENLRQSTEGFVQSS